VDQLIKKGYRVRGSVRDSAAQAWMTSHFGPNFSLVQVPDFGVPGAFDYAAEGVDGIAHIASNVHFSADAEAFIRPVERAAINILEAAVKQPSVKSVVLCSSQVAAYQIRLNTPYVVTVDSWNDEAIEAAWNNDLPPDAAKSAYVYAASKVQAERSSWEWVKKHQPHFVFNAVLPNVSFGGVVSLKHQGFRSTPGLVKALWDGYTLGTEMIGPQWCCGVDETVLLHIAALILPEIKNERIFAFGHPYDWNQILDIFKKMYPERKFLNSVPDAGKDVGKVPNERAAEILRQMGRPGFESMEESIRKAVQPVLEAENGAEYALTQMDQMLAGQKSGLE